MFARVARFENADFAKEPNRVDQEVARMRAARDEVLAGNIPEGMDEAGIKAINECSSSPTGKQVTP